MGKNRIFIEVFGADAICASCIQGPSSKDTYEWLQAALTRKYPHAHFDMMYIDIDHEITNERQRHIAEQIKNDEYFYPLIVLNGEIIGEGNIQIKSLFTALEQLGFENHM